MELNKYIDHTLLKATATTAQIRTLCREAIDNDFYAVCVNSSYIPLAFKELEGSDVKLAAVARFPLGAMATDLKLAEAKYCMDNGAGEIDVVMNIGLFKSGELEAVQKELSQIKEALGDVVLKVIIETCYLTKEEIVAASKLVVESGADFVKTSTGFGDGGATFEDVELMCKTVDGKIKVKASGGIRDRETALRYIEIGASRLGTSSGIKIIQA